MKDKYILINRRIRSIIRKCTDIIDLESYDQNGYVENVLSDYIIQDVKDILRVWPSSLKDDYLQKIIEKVNSEENGKYYDIIKNILPKIENLIDDYYENEPIGDLSNSILQFLHPIIIESSYHHFSSNRFRDAVFNAIVAVFDFIRSKTHVDKDGVSLIGDVLSLNSPKLILSELDTESGINDQKGFLQIFQGAYIGIRNPKAHSLDSDLDQLKAAQYLVFLSLLARRIDEAIINN